jgi:quercetin dioxygenase-like cupin family protein
MKKISLSETEKVKVTMEGASGAFKQIPLSKNDGAPAFCFRVFSLEPKGHTPYHKHDFEHLNYVIQGHGAMISEDGDECEIKQGEFAMVLPNELHQYKNKSETEPFVFICAVPNEYE